MDDRLQSPYTNSLFILTHYFGAVVVGLQGLLFLAHHRARAARTWPAVFAFLPAAVSVSVHAARLIVFVQPGSAWLPVLGWNDLVPQLYYLSGGSLLAIYLGVWICAGLIARWRRKSAGPAAIDFRSLALWQAVGCALAASFLAIGLGMFKPMFTDRYLTAYTPGCLLGLALLADGFRRDWKPAAFALVSAFFVVAIIWSLRRSDEFNPYNFEYASHALMADSPRKLAFLWDNPSRPEPSALGGVGGFFFRRAGKPVDVLPTYVGRGQDPNAVLLKRAAEPGTDILWIYDLGVRGTAALRFPPDIGNIDVHWYCRDFGSDGIGVIACSRARGSIWSLTQAPSGPRIAG